MITGTSGAITGRPVEIVGVVGNRVQLRDLGTGLHVIRHTYSLASLHYDTIDELIAQLLPYTRLDVYTGYKPGDHVRLIRDGSGLKAGATGIVQRRDGDRVVINFDARGSSLLVHPAFIALISAPSPRLQIKARRLRLPPAYQGRSKK
jgi:hypothetical protein